MKSLLNQFKDIQDMFGDKSCVQLDDDMYLKYQDILGQMEYRKYIIPINVDGAYLYRKNAEFDEFEKWLKEEIKNNKKMNRRDWIIAIVSGSIGAAVGLIPWIISLFS